MKRKSWSVLCSGIIIAFQFFSVLRTRYRRLYTQRDVRAVANKGTLYAWFANQPTYPLKRVQIFITFFSSILFISCVPTRTYVNYDRLGSVNIHVFYNIIYTLRDKSNRRAQPSVLLYTYNVYKYIYMRLLFIFSVHYTPTTLYCMTRVAYICTDAAL